MPWLPESYTPSMDSSAVLRLRLSIVLAQAEHESLDMPSWAPDWRKPPSRTALSAPLAYRNVYNACGRFNLDNNRGKPMAKINGGELSTPGFSFDTIVKVSDIFDKPDLSYRDTMAQNATLLASVAFALEMRNEPYGDKIFEALWRTLVAGKNDEGISTCPESFAEIFSVLIDQTTGKSPSLPGQTYSARQKLPEGRGTMELHNLSERTLGQTSLQARIALRRALTNRRLGITKNGYLGLFPGHVGKGDYVYVFDRCPLPYALRSVGSEGKFRFIGECFVYGIMHEEAAWSEEICLIKVTLL